MGGVTVKIPNVKLLLQNRKYLFWFFVILISTLVVSILTLIIVINTKRDFESFPLTSYHSGCADLTSQWHEWESGSSGTIKVKRERSGWDYIWELEMVYDKPVQAMEVTGGVVDQVSGARFRITPTSTYSRGGQEDMKVQFKANYLPGASPVLESIVVNGKYHRCPGPPPGTGGQGGAPPATTQHSFRSRSHPAWPGKVLGLYVLLADDDEDGYESNAEWEQAPELFEWQQEAANVLFFTFIHPETMDVPPSFQTLAATRGSGAPGSVPANTVIMFAIGGYAYSIKPNPWHWLTSREAAEKMAEKVATWPDLYGCDGIDLDLEEGAGSNKIAGPNMVHFVRKLKQLNPSMIVSQPTYGYPQVQAEIDVINESWDEAGNKQGVADSIGLMVYEGTQALNYVKNYVAGADQWEGFPVKVRAPSNVILLGAKGSASSSAINQLAEAVVREDYLGIMVWYASVKNGFDYAPGWDASTSNDAISGYIRAMDRFRSVPGASPAPLPAPVEPRPQPSPAPVDPKPQPLPAPVQTTARPVIAPVEAELEEITPSSSGHPAWPNKVS